MMGMNQFSMTLDQIQFIMGQNPMIKSMIYTLIQYPMIINQVANIINILNHNPFIVNQLRNQMNQEMMMNSNLMNMMKNWTMMNKGMVENISKDKELIDNPTINIIFRKSGEGSNTAPIMIECKRKDKVSEAIQRYRNISRDFDDTEKFVYNAIQLNPSLTLEEANMGDYGNVFVVVTKGVKGG